MSSEDNTLIFQILNGAYQDDGSSIAIGQTIPEPQTAVLGLATLALGAAGLRQWRKGRAKT